MTFISNAKHMVPTLKLINWNFISCFYNFWGKKAREGKSEEAKSLRDGRVVTNSEWKWKSLSRVWLFATPWYSPWNSLGQNTGVGSLLQGIFPTQRSNPGLLHCRQILNQLSQKGSPRILEWVAYPLSSGSSDPGIKLGSPVLQADSLPTEL